MSTYVVVERKPYDNFEVLRVLRSLLLVKQNAELNGWADKDITGSDCGIIVEEWNDETSERIRYLNVHGLTLELSAGQKIWMPHRTAEKALTGAEVPKTVAEAVNRLLECDLGVKDKAFISKLPKDDLITLHHTLGRWIRNNYGLWQDNKALLADTSETHPDDASMVIIEKCWEALRG